MTEQAIVEVIGHCINIQTLAEDQMNDERDGPWRQRLESRMEMIIGEADLVAGMIAEGAE